MTERTERHLGALVEAGMILASTLELEDLLQRIADLSREVIGAAYGAVGVLGAEGDLLRFVYSGIDDATADKIGDLPSGRGVLGALIEEGRPLRLVEISDHPRSYGFPEHHPSMHTFLGVPIIIRGHIYGRLYLTEKAGGAPFSKDDERIASTLAAQAGVAIENAQLYDEVRERGDELARRVNELSSIERVGDLLISESSVDSMLRSAAEEACKLTGGTRSTVLLEDRSGHLIVRQAVGSVSQDLVGRPLPQFGSKAAAVMRRMKGEVVDDLGADDEVDRRTTEFLGNPRSGAFVPLIVRSRAIGALTVYDRHDGLPFSSDDLVVLQVLANQAAIAIENERLTDALRDMAVLEERERISKELHDGVIQSIYSVGLSLQGSLSMLERDTGLARKRIDDSIAELDNVVRDVRSYIFELQPKLVQEKGLQDAIKELVRDLEVNTLATTSVTIEEDSCLVLPPGDESQVIQIVREILSNIARHAQATVVELSCRRMDGEVVLQVADDGIGFDPSTVRRGHGLKNMEERARKLDGLIEIEQRDPSGTIHRLRIPEVERTA